MGILPYNPTQNNIILSRESKNIPFYIYKYDIINPKLYLGDSPYERP